MRIKHTTVLLVAIAMVTMTAPVGAADQDPVREQNREWLTSQTDTWHPDAEATVYKWDGEHVMTAEEALDQLLDRLDRIGLDLDDAFGPTPQSHSTGPANHTAGNFWIFENNMDPEISCNQGGGGAGGHYDHAAPVPSHEENVLGVPVGTYSHVGTATSNISLGDGARAIMGPVYSVEVGVIGASFPGSQGYADEIRYEGSSDFHCIEFGWAGFTVNSPVVRGTFGPTPDTPDSPV